MTGTLFNLLVHSQPYELKIPGIDLAEEDRKFMQYLADNGWRGDVGEESVGDDSSVDDSELEKQQFMKACFFFYL